MRKIKFACNGRISSAPYPTRVVINALIKK